MVKYLNILTLCFNLSWVMLFTGIQAARGAHKHFVFLLGCATSLMLCFECYREIVILCWHVETQPTPIRVWVYGAEHVLLGMVIMEALHYVNICREHRKRRHRID